MRFRAFIIFFFLSASLFAQGEANTWYFGRFAGVDFNSSPPSILSDGQLNTNEGCSTISDVNGNLLFYTDGRTIWNRNHQIMPNANYFNGNGLLGDPSSTSSGLIVPYPSDPDLYYVFTVDEPHHDNAFAYPGQGPANPDGSPRPNYSDIPTHSVPQDDDGYNNGFNYSVVDLSLENGMGDVDPDEKNIELRTYDASDPEQVRYKCSEKITAVKADVCNSIWVITQFVNNFYAFKIDENGLDTVPVISNLGPIVSTDDYRRAALGYLKASPDGNKLLIAHNTRGYDQTGIEDQQNGGVWLYDFNPATGEVTNSQNLVNGVNAYGVEFSPDATKAYATVTQNGQFKLLQWDLESNGIANSMVELDGTSGQSATALQLAPNGKIYTPTLGTTKLSVINNPNASGNAANYSESYTNGAINLYNPVSYGLPPFIQSFFANRVNIVNNAEIIETNVALCDGENYTLGRETINGASYIWTRDGDTLNHSSSELTVAQPENTALPVQQTYRLFIDRNNGDCVYKGLANVTFYPYPQPINDTLTNCGTSEGSMFNLENAEVVTTQYDSHLSFDYYRNLNDAENSTDAIENSANYNTTSPSQTVAVVITDTVSGCSSYAEITLNTTSQENLEPVDLYFCTENPNYSITFDLNRAKTQILDRLNEDEGDFEISFYDNSDNAILGNNAITELSAYQNVQPPETTIYASIRSSGRCYDIVPVNLQVNAPIDILNDETVYYCIDNYPTPIEIQSGIDPEERNDYTYQWFPTGETTPTIQVNDTMTYQVIATQKISGCQAGREIHVVASGQADFTLSKTEYAFNENTIEVNVSPQSIGNYVFSLNGTDESNFQESPLFTGVSPGQHTVYVKDLNGCGITQQDINIVSFMRFFTPNQDGINDRWHLIGRDQGDLRDVKISIFTRYGKLIKSFRGNYPGWDGTFNGKKMPSNDYWYYVETGEGETFKGHFTLKR